jgi:nucleolar protein 9
LNLYLLQKKPEQWRDMQASKRTASVVQPKATQDDQISTEIKGGGTGEKEIGNNKRKRGNDIDAVFDAALGKKVKKGALGAGDEAVGQSPSAAASIETEKGKRKKKEINDTSLKDVFGAIKAAPKDKQHPKKKSH